MLTIHDTWAEGSGTRDALGVSMRDPRGVDISVIVDEFRRVSVTEPPTIYNADELQAIHDTAVKAWDAHLEAAADRAHP